MKRCEMSVIPAFTGGVVLFCVTCYETVASADVFTIAEIAATAAGHRQVMKRARTLRALHEKKLLDNPG